MTKMAWTLTLGFALVYLATGNPTAFGAALIAAVAGIGLENK